MTETHKQRNSPATAHREQRKRGKLGRDTEREGTGGGGERKTDRHTDKCTEIKTDLEGKR